MGIFLWECYFTKNETANKQKTLKERESINKIHDSLKSLHWKNVEDYLQLKHASRIQLLYILNKE